MPLYAYRAINARGRSTRGELNCSSEIALFQELQALNLTLVDAREVKRKQLRLGGRIKARDKVQLCVHLEHLSRAGVPLLDGLADVRDSTDNASLKDIMTEIHTDVSEGTALSDAFSKRPKVFGTMITSLIQAGEDSGNLTDSFHQLVKHLKWADEINRKIKKAVRYPSIMLVLIVGIFFFMMAYVVPQVMSFLKSTNQELPFYTEALIATSDFVQDNVVMLILLPIVAFIINKIVRRASPGYCFFMDETLLKLPVLGSIVRKISIARFTHFFATMFQAGVPILQCLSTSGRVITNMKLRDSIEQVGEQVQNGVAFSDAMRQTGEFPSLVVRMIRIGEDSGNLSQTLENVTEFYDQDVNESIDSLIAMIEPALIAVTGLLMAWIIISVFGPIYDSFGNLGI